MRNPNRRVDDLERKFTSDGEQIVIWAMTDGRRMTRAEIDAAFLEAIANGRASPADELLAISWTSG
jgi:hypothetical protein